MTNRASSVTGGPCCLSGCDLPKHVTKSGVIKPRCTQHWQEQTAQMRLAARGRPEREQRPCAHCGQLFTWRSEHPRQQACSKACYMARREQHLQRPRSDRLSVNARSRERIEIKQAAQAGISREEMADRRFGPCEICARTDRAPLHWDHHHASDAFRGFVCAFCNHLLGNANDDPDVLRAAIAYLERTTPA